MNPETSKTTGLRSQPTKKGGVLLWLSKESGKAAFAQQVLGRANEGIKKVRARGRSHSSRREVGVSVSVGIPDEGRHVKLLNPNRCKLRLAVAILGEHDAEGHLRVCYFTLECRSTRPNIG